MLTTETGHLLCVLKNEEVHKNISHLRMVTIGLANRRSYYILQSCIANVCIIPALKPSEWGQGSGNSDSNESSSCS